MELSQRRLRQAVIFSESVVLALAVLVFWLTGVRPSCDGDVRTAALGLVVGAVCAAIVVALIASSAPWVAGLRSDFERVAALFAHASAGDIVAMSLLAGVCEEVLFRGALQTWMAGFLNVHVAILLAALAFGLVHAISWRYAVFAGVLGVALGYTFYLTGDLVAAASAHAAYDLLALMWARRSGFVRPFVT